MSEPTPVTALVTLEDVIAHLNFDNPDQYDELLGFINAATSYIQDVTGPIVWQTFTEVFSGNGPHVVLRNPPVLTVQSVTEWIGPTAYALTQSELGTPTGAYGFSLDDPAAGVLTRRYNGGIVGNFPAGDRNIQVTYTAGLPVVPPDIRMAVLQDIAGLYQPSQLGPGSSMFPSSMGGDPASKPNPIGLFPRVAAILSTAKTRGPAIA